MDLIDLFLEQTRYKGVAGVVTGALWSVLGDDTRLETLRDRDLSRLSWVSARYFFRIDGTGVVAERVHGYGFFGELWNHAGLVPAKSTHLGYPVALYVSVFVKTGFVQILAFESSVGRVLIAVPIRAFYRLRGLHPQDPGGSDGNGCRAAKTPPGCPSVGR